MRDRKFAALVLAAALTVISVAALALQGKVGIDFRQGTIEILGNGYERAERVDGR